MKSTSTVVVVVAAGVMLVASPVIPVDAQGQGLAVGRPEWVAALRHDTSRPLRDVAPGPPVSTRQDFAVKMAPPSQEGGQADPVVQSFVTSPLAAVGGVSFDGVGEGNPQFAYNVNVAPPDTNGEAGLTQYVQWVNTSFAIFDKTDGTRLYGPAGGNTLWSGFGGLCETRNDGDPIVQYDQLANRWVMTQFALSLGNYLQCVAISQTDDATGAWYRYAFAYDEFPDYPKLSVWPDAYYITFNMFGRIGNRFTGGRVCAYERDRMLNGQSAIQICYQLSNYASLLASDLDGQTLPPGGAPNYVLNRGTNSLRLWRFSPDFATPANSTLVGPTTIAVNAFTPACTQQCVPQPGTTQLLDVLGDRLMYRLSYRNLGTRESLLVNHSVLANSVTGVRWYELDVTGGVASVRQQSTYAPNDGQHRWMGSLAMDQVGNIAVGYSIGSATMKPSIRFAGREATDFPNLLSIDNSLQTGTGSQLTTLSRWGDYSNMAVDPVDDCTFWFTSEYLQTNGTFNWSTRVGSFKFESCQASDPEPTFALAATPSSATVTVGESTSFDASVAAQNGYTGDGAFSVSGLPAGATGVFTPAGYTGGSGDTTLAVSTAADTPTGSFPLTITATDTNGTPVRSTNVTLTVNPVAAADFTLSVSPNSRNVKRGSSVNYGITVTGDEGFSETVTFSVDGCPANTSCTISPASVDGSGPAELTVQTTNASPRGRFTLTVTGTSASASHSATVSLRVQ